MTVQNLTVTEDEGEQRLDKWLRRRFPQLNQVAVEKLCRTGQSAGRQRAGQGLGSCEAWPDGARPAFAGSGLQGLKRASRVSRPPMPR